MNDIAPERIIHGRRAETEGHDKIMSPRRKLYPFNAEQTVNILSEFGPLVTMFIVNAMYGINAGTWALISTTVLAIVAMIYMFGRPPVFPLIASTVTIVFGTLTLVTKDPMWVQIKVTIFNALFAGFLFLGLWLDRNFFQYVFDKTFHYTKEGWDHVHAQLRLVLPVYRGAERIRSPDLQGRHRLRGLRLRDERDRHLDRIQAVHRPAAERFLRLAADQMDEQASSVKS